MVFLSQLLGLGFDCSSFEGISFAFSHEMNVLVINQNIGVIFEFSLESIVAQFKKSVVVGDFKSNKIDGFLEIVEFHLGLLALINFWKMINDFHFLVKKFRFWPIFEQTHHIFYAILSGNVFKFLVFRSWA